MRVPVVALFNEKESPEGRKSCVSGVVVCGASSWAVLSGSDGAVMIRRRVRTMGGSFIESIDRGGEELEGASENGVLSLATL